MMSQWPDHCDEITWEVISNSLDIDFIHGDIHGQSRKNKDLYMMCAKESYIGSACRCVSFYLNMQTCTQHTFAFDMLQ